MTRPRRLASNGSGSIFLRKDGRWCLAIYLDEADGRRVRHRYYGRRRAETEEGLVELRSKVQSGAPIAPSRLTVRSISVSG